MSSTSAFYSRPSYLSGAGTIYSGARRQRGGSVFGAIKSIVTPLISTIGRSLKKNVLPNVINNAAGFANDVVGDIATGKNVKESLINRGKQRGLRTLKQTLDSAVNRRKPKRATARRRQRGSGKKRLRKRSKSVRKTSRKRRKTIKHSIAKRRRANF